MRARNSSKISITKSKIKALRIQYQKSTSRANRHFVHLFFCTYSSLQTWIATWPSEFTEYWAIAFRPGLLPFDKSKDMEGGSEEIKIQFEHTNYRLGPIHMMRLLVRRKTIPIGSREYECRKREKAVIPQKTCVYSSVDRKPLQPPPPPLPKKYLSYQLLQLSNRRISARFNHEGNLS